MYSCETNWEKPDQLVNETISNINENTGGFNLFQSASLEAWLTIVASITYLRNASAFWVCRRIRFGRA